MHWASLGVSYLSSRLIKFVASSPLRGTIANRLGFTMLVERNARSLLLSSAGLALTTVNSPRIEDLVSMMRLFMRSWLLLQQAGLAVQPMILSVLYSYFEKCGCLPDDLPPDFVALFRQGDRLVRQAFACPDDEIPLALCRVGVPPGPFPGRHDERFGVTSSRWCDSRRVQSRPRNGIDDRSRLNRRRNGQSPRRHRAPSHPESAGLGASHGQIDRLDAPNSSRTMKSCGSTAWAR